MTRETVQSGRIGEQYYSMTHPSGLKMKLYPMEGFSSAYAMFSTEYGSIDVEFKTGTDADYARVPEGIAHFLEHKLFESEEGDAFTRYAETGASANAYTTFDRTAYLFSCTDRFEQSLEILLDFVTKPYFTPETVQKEQGIIGQEIRMYEDSADWQCFFGLITALYHKNPVNVDIIGTVESIAQIDAELLYRCYHTFYNLGKMVLTIAGNFDVETVLAVADRILKPGEPVTIERKIPDEPAEVKEERKSKNLEVAMPLFQIGFKGIPAGKTENFRLQVLDEIVNEVMIGESSELYGRLYNGGLINSEFASEVFCGRDYISLVYGGESKDPEAVYAAIRDELARNIRDGLDPARFEICKRALYGRYVRMFDKVDAVAGLMLSSHFAGVDPFELLDLAANATVEAANARLRSCYNAGRGAMSVVLPVANG